MNGLDPEQFGAFFRELWGVEPFPWQRELARRVVESGWPDALDLPTASGKTAALDIAVFHLALEADRGNARRAPVRIFFVVDRRLVVDSAHERACEIARRLRAANDGVLKLVADRLRLLADDPAEPLRVVRLRGGMPKEPDWVTSVAQPTVVVSTVDQVGSRLLFRGYGVSPSMAPVHAGLVGIDSVILLDEAHLSRAFAETAKAVARLQAKADPASEHRRLRVVPLSATLPDDDEDAFGLTPADRAHPVLAPRLESSKPARLETLRAEEDDLAAVADEVAALARELAADDGAHVVAVVVNRVALARAVFETLEAASGDGETDVGLLTGRSRPLDRRRVEDELVRYTGATRARDGEQGRRFVVATQCVEVGADLDFDALVTELAPIDALRQRFGRLDRLGRHHDAGKTVPAIVFTTRGAIAKKAKPDPIYGEAPRRTWDWLQTVAEKTKAGPVVRFGVADWQPPEQATLETLIALPSSAPVVFPVYAELWAQTNPPPAVDPWPPLFLHGIGSDRPAEVQIVFRADIDETDLREERRDALIRLLETAPPSSLEVLTLPLGAARRWLAGATSADVGDVVGADGGVQEQDARADRALAFRWAGGEGAPLTAGRIRPGDTLVVPAARGGCDRWGWAPGDERWVADLTTEAMLRHRHRLVWRLTPVALRAAADPEEEVRFTAMAELLGRAELAPQDLLTAIPATPGLPERWRRTAAFLDDEPTSIALELVRLDETDPARGAWLVSRRRLSPKMAEELAGLLVEGDVIDATSNGENIAQEAATEDDLGSFGEATAVLLEDHLHAVAARVADQTRRAGMPPELASLVELAARHHDTGKAEPRFQAWLAGTDELGVMGAAPLAKSGHVRPPGWDRRLRKVAGWPPGARHEAWSVRLAEDAPAVRNLSPDDAELVLHLIAAHHGHGRPFFPAVDDAGDLDVLLDLDGEQLCASGDHGLARLDAGICERFAALNARLGPWQLAWLEAILRLADHRVSREGR
jgi:CRISPR-associated endonuclease/helicase Cas3